MPRSGLHFVLLVLGACGSGEGRIERGVLTLEWEHLLFHACGEPDLTQIDPSIDPRYWERAQAVLDAKGVCALPLVHCPLRTVYVEARTRRNTPGTVALTEILDAQPEPPASCSLPSIVVPPPDESLEQSGDR